MVSTMTFEQAVAIANRDCETKVAYSEVNSNLREHDGDGYWFMVLDNENGLPEALGAVVSVAASEVVPLGLTELALLSNDMEAIVGVLRYFLSEESES